MAGDEPTKKAGAKRPAGAPAEERRPAGLPQDEDGVRSADEEREEDAAAAQTVEHDLDALLGDVRRERDEYLEAAQRARADFENYRKRMVREVSDAERRGKAEIARDLLPALDNLERALQAAGVDTAGGTARAGDGPSEEVSTHEAMARGVALVHQELLDTLERAGIESYDPAGERFDPAWHEALTTRAEDGKESGIVLETLEKGYRLDGQVIRAARVIVSG